MSSSASPLRFDTPSALPPGTRLGEFELVQLLGVGGFGIVYLAFDHALEREVAVKEYMPATLVGRTETLHVSLRSQSDAEVFALGLRSFVNEAKLLARFDHPSLLKVYRFWEANGTAYMAMPVLRGKTLKDLRAQMNGAPEERWLRDMLMPLLGAIEKLHSEGVYHRDIAPDNIQIEPDGRPVLMDFGAARRVLSDRSQALTAILKPAYAPIEQYGEAGSVKQGPWTDLYALGATLHYMLLSRPPAPATTRTVHDEGTDLTPDQLPHCSQSFLDAIDWMLCPRPTDRPQSVAQLRDVLTGRARCPARRVPQAAPTAWERTSVLPHDAADEGVDLDLAPTPVAPEPRLQALAPTVPAGGGIEHVQIEPTAPPARPAPAPARTDFAASVGRGVTATQPDMDMAAERAPQALAPAKRSRLPLILGATLAVTAVAAATLWLRAPTPAPIAPEPAPAASAPAAVVPASASMPLPAAAGPAMASGASASAPALAVESAPLVVPPSAPVKTVEVPPSKPAAAAPVKPEPRPKPEAKPRSEVAAPVVAPVAIPESAGPGPSCGARESVRYHVCMERECALAEFSTHSACLRWKQDARRE